MTYTIKTERSINLGDNCSATFSRWEGVVTVRNDDWSEQVNLKLGQEQMFKAIKGYIKDARYIGDASDQRLYAERLESLISAATESIRILRENNIEVFADKSEEVTAS